MKYVGNEIHGTKIDILEESYQVIFIDKAEKEKDLSLHLFVLKEL
jgi:hypothetical protein